ncbi:hypothetical protein BDW62DRAFT_117512 [Aspergillus aurantiobrunneus]
MGKTFQKIHASSVGSFENNTNKIPQWITANRGTYSKEITGDTTHLVATKEVFKGNSTAVVEAKKLETVNIVSYDWLVESLLSKSRTPRLAKSYLWVSILKNEKKKGQGQEKIPENEGDQVGGHAEGDQKKGRQTAKAKKAKVTPVKKRRKKRAPAKSTDPFDTKSRTAKLQGLRQDTVFTKWETRNTAPHWSGLQRLPRAPEKLYT